jgi:prophage antirepressor-like protein
MVGSGNGLRKMLIVNEYGIYETVFESRKPEAKAFKRWVFDLLKTLRQQTGLEGFQIFRMLDKEHQRAAMARLSQSLRQPARIDFIKANTIANKAVSTRYGYKKMLKKHEMTPEMLVYREPILEDTVELMGVVNRFGLPVKVSDAIYQKYVQ